MNTLTFSQEVITRVVQLWTWGPGFLLLVFFQVRNLLTLAVGIFSFFKAILETCYIS